MRVLAVPASAAALLLGPVVPAEGSAVPDTYDLRLHAAAASAAFRALGPDAASAGFSRVRLAQGSPRSVIGRCDATGAGLYEGDLLSSAGLRPSDPRRGRLNNPTVVSRSAPDLQPGSGWLERRRRNPPPPTPAQQAQSLGERAETDAIAFVRTGPAAGWSARCDHDGAGRAAAGSGALPGIGAAGSATIAELDRSTGRYVGTARAFVTGVETAAGTVDLVSAILVVRSAPGQEPRVGYRLVVTQGPATSVLASGADVPGALLTEQFRRSAAGSPTSLRLMDPQVTRSPGGTWTVQAPFVELRTGDSTARLVAVGFSGRHPASAAGTSSAGT